jgi:hypothetical protein
MVWNSNAFYFRSPHPNPLPQGEREFPDENKTRTLSWKRNQNKKRKL